MSKFRKLELIPLTNIKDLNLDIVKNEVIEVERSEEVDKALKNILSYIKSNPNTTKIGNKVGTENYISTQIKASVNKKKIYTFPEPNPICIYYNIAIENLEQSYKLKNLINNKSQNFNPLEDYDNFTKYFSFTSQGIIFLITAIEGFINQFFKEDIEYIFNEELKTKKDLEFAKLDDKISNILPIITGINFKEKNKDAYNKILNTNSIRNDLIHLKQIETDNNTNYQELFKKIIDFKHIENSEAVFMFLNVIKPNYFKENVC